MLTAIGYSYPEVMAVSEGRFIQLVYEKDRQNFTECLQNPDIASHEFRIINISGKNIWVNSYKKSSFSIDNRPIIIASIRVAKDYINPDDHSFAAILNKLNFFSNPDENGGNYKATYFPRRRRRKTERAGCAQTAV